MKKFIASFLAIAICVCITPRAFANENPVIDLDAKSAVLMELSSGNLIYQQNPDMKLAPASITKIMTMLLVMEHIANGNLSYDDKVSASEHACSMGGSQIWLEPGEVMTIDELLKATAVNSANDAAVALGEAVAGTEEAFVALMNQKAQELGMVNTTFKNASGLDEQGHITTAKDIAIMSRALLSYPDITNYTTIWQGELRGGETALTNTNKLVRFYEGITGLKTGTTDDAGHCLSASAKRGDLEFVAVIMGSTTTDNRNAAARKLLDYGFATYCVYTPSQESIPPTEIKISGAKSDFLKIEPYSLQKVVVKKGIADKLQTKIDLPEKVSAPIKKGDNVGQIEYFTDTETILTVPIVASEDMPKLTFFGALFKLITAVYK